MSEQTTVTSEQDATDAAESRRARGECEFPVRVISSFGVICITDPFLANNMEELRKAVKGAIEFSPCGQAEIIWPE